MARAAALLATDADALRVAALAVRSAPELSARNATIGEYVTGYSFLQSLVPSSPWEFLRFTDLKATADLVNRSFHPDTSETLCSTFQKDWRPRFYSYNVFGKMLARTVATRFCLDLPLLRSAATEDSANRKRVLRLLEPRY
jgi:hypothetical protein